MADKLDLTKPVQTRGGRPVRILCTDALGDDPIVGLMIQSSGHELVRRWRSTGEYDYGACHNNSKNNLMDLINVPPKPVKYYTHVYGHPDTRPGNHLTHTTTCKEPSPMTLPLIKTIEFEV